MNRKDALQKTLDEFPHTLNHKEILINFGKLLLINYNIPKESEDYKEWKEN